MGIEKTLYIKKQCIVLYKNRRLKKSADHKYRYVDKLKSDDFLTQELITNYLAIKHKKKT